MKVQLRNLCCLTLCLALVEVPFAAHQARASSMIPTSVAVSSLVLTESRAKVERFMQRADVRTQIEKFGVNPAEAALRVATMTDAEIQKIAGEIDRAPAGADVIVISLTTVLLIVIILILLGKL